MDRPKNVPASGIRGFPRNLVYLFLPLVSFLAYLVLLLGCLSNTFQDVYLAEFQSNGQATLGTALLPIDLRVAYLGVCFGPRNFYCTAAGLGTKNVTDLTLELPASKSGGTVALASLAQALQSNFLVPSGFGLVVLLFIDLIANVMEVAVDAPYKADKRAKAALWVRCIDWATTAAAIVALADYLSLVATIPNLIRVAFIEQVTVKVGTAAIAIHSAIAGATFISAAIKTFLVSDELQLRDMRPSLKRLEQGYGGPMPPGRPTPFREDAFSPPAPYETRFNRVDRKSRMMSRIYGRS
ncbi:hypothetical protein GQ53DRAFT_77522 [Thozetella sp. PMI_491]|nr:hypothetical protein GQ53DRAFT_77522 [Thozetella sp. PMI_491]